MMKRLVIAVALLTGVALAEPAFASDAKASAKAIDGEKHAKATGDAPNPLNQMGLNRADLGIYTLLVFAILFFVLSKFAWKPIIQGLDKREALIRSAKDEAERSLAETAKLRADLEASKAAGAAEVKAMIDEARRDAEAVREQLKAEATRDIQTERDRLRREIEVAKDQALAEINGRAVQLATLISNKTVRRKLSEDDHRQLLDEALGDLRNNLKA